MRMLPEARIGHSSANRLRIKIDHHRGDMTYFERVTRELMNHFQYQTIQSNAVTGSILMVSDSISASEVDAFAREQQLFSIDFAVRKPKPVVNILAAPVENFHQKVQQTTGGALDLPGLIFITALFFGVYEIAKGNFRSPPWYTAFWYAFGMYSKSFFESKIADKPDSTDNR